MRPDTWNIHVVVCMIRLCKDSFSGTRVKICYVRVPFPSLRTSTLTHGHMCHWHMSLWDGGSVKDSVHKEMEWCKWDSIIWRKLRIPMCVCVRESDTVQPCMLGGKIWFLVCDIMMACGRESEIFGWKTLMCEHACVQIITYTCTHKNTLPSDPICSQWVTLCSSQAVLYTPPSVKVQMDHMWKSSHLFYTSWSKNPWCDLANEYFMELGGGGGVHRASQDETCMSS